MKTHRPVERDFVTVYYKDIKRIFLSRFGASCRVVGLDSEEVLQEIYIGFVRKQRSDKSKFILGKSSVSHYIFVVCRSLFLNYLKKIRRQREFEQIGVRNDDGVLVDAATIADCLEAPPIERINQDTIDSAILAVAERVGDPRIAFEIKANMEKYRSIMMYILIGRVDPAMQTLLNETKRVFKLAVENDEIVKDDYTITFL